MIILPFLAPFIYSFAALRGTLIRAKPGGENSKIKATLLSFLKNQNIREDLIFKEKKIPEFCAAVGTNFAKTGAAIIFVAPSFYTVDEKACLWVMKHEIAHIKSNDYFFMNMIAAFSSLPCAVFAIGFLNEISGFLLAMSFGMVSKIFWSRYRESKADDFANSHSSLEELRGGRRFLLSLRAVAIEEYKKSIWNKLRLSRLGEWRFKYLHPSTKHRLQKIEGALGQLQPEEITPLIELLKGCGSTQRAAKF